MLKEIAFCAVAGAFAVTACGESYDDGAYDARSDPNWDFVRQALGVEVSGDGLGGVDVLGNGLGGIAVEGNGLGTSSSGGGTPAPSPGPGDGAGGGTGDPPPVGGGEAPPVGGGEAPPVGGGDGGPGNTGGEGNVDCTAVCAKFSSCMFPIEDCESQCTSTVNATQATCALAASCEGVPACFGGPE